MPSSCWRRKLATFLLVLIRIAAPEPRNRAPRTRPRSRAGVTPCRCRCFCRLDETPDALFYAEPRFVAHIDDGAIEAVTALYRERLPRAGF